MAESCLRKALAYGADRAVLLTDRRFSGSDTLATTCALAGAIREQHVIADHHPHAVIDEEAAPDGCAGVDFDSGEEPASLGDQARQSRHLPAIKLVSHAMRQDGVKAWVPKENLHYTLRRWILAKDRIDLFPDGLSLDAAVASGHGHCPTRKFME